MTMGQADSGQVQGGHAAGIGFLRRPAHGAQQTLLLLHGIGSNARSFLPLISALPPQIDVIAWNAPGYADSARLAETAPTPRDYADALATLLDSLGIARVALAGHSLGALFAASFAARHPARVAVLALLSPAIGYNVPAGAPLPAAVQARIDEIGALGPAAFAAKRAARLVGSPDRKPHIVAAVETAMAQVDPAGYAQAVRALGAGHLLADASAIAAPTLVAVGTADVITPPENARAIHARLKQAAGYHEINGTGHALPQEEPAAVARLLVQLIEDAAHV